MKKTLLTGLITLNSVEAANTTCWIMPTGCIVMLGEYMKPLNESANSNITNPDAQKKKVAEACVEWIKDYHEIWAYKDDEEVEKICRDNDLFQKDDFNNKTI